jgi:multidrug efflux system outer membrane protein
LGVAWAKRSAASYINLRALDRQLEIARAAAKNYGGTQEIFALRFKGGVVSEIELRQVESQYQQALAAIPSLELQVAAQENLLSILLGRNPGVIPRGRSIDELAAPGIPGDLPSTLLARRPDILQAEQQLAAATANIGAARSLYFPTLSLTGLLGSVSTALGDFLGSARRRASLARGPARADLHVRRDRGPVQTRRGRRSARRWRSTSGRSSTRFARRTTRSWAR